jgi:hypothetical protein
MRSILVLADGDFPETRGQHAENDTHCLVDAHKRPHSDSKMQHSILSSRLSILVAGPTRIASVADATFDLAVLAQQRPMRHVQCYVKLAMFVAQEVCALAARQVKL